MRIVVLSDTTIADGGAEMLSLAMVRRMAERGLDVTFIAADDSENPELDALGVKRLNIGASRISPGAGARALIPALYNPKVKSFLDRYVREHDGSDVVYHVHAWSKALSPSLFAALAPVADRTFIHAHDFFLVCPNANFFNFTTERACGQKPLTLGCVTASCSKRGPLDKTFRVVRGGLLRGVMKARQPWRLFLIHDAMRGRFIDAGFASERLIATPNPSEPLTPTPVDAAANRSFLFIGRLLAEKGPDLACAAATAAGVDLVVVGDGEMRAELEAAYPTVTFAGWMSKDQIRPLAEQARALVMTSRSPEPFGLAAAEALGSGLPVIAARSALLAADMERAGCGRAVEATDRDAVAAVLRALASDDDAVRAMSVAALAAYRQISPTVDAWIDGMIASYEAALGAA